MTWFCDVFAPFIAAGVPGWTGPSTNESCQALKERFEVQILGDQGACVQTCEEACAVRSML